MFFLARVSAGRSSLCIGARSRGESTVRKGGAKFFVFWLPRVHSRPNFWIKSETHPERRRNEMEREREILYFVLVFSFVGMFLSFLFRALCVF